MANFFPVGVVGDFATYGPIIFINNQMNVLIVQTSGDKPVYLSNVQMQGTAGTTAVIFIVSDDLVTAESNQGRTVITQYSLDNVLSPTKVKSFAPTGTDFSNPLKITADDFFLYVLLKTNIINVYKPSVSTHNALYR